MMSYPGKTIDAQTTAGIWLVLLPLLILGTVPKIQADDAPQQAEQTATPKEPDEKEPHEADFPPLPDGSLTVPDGFADSQAYEQAIAAKVSELAAAGDRAADPITKTEYWLASANHALAYELEPYVSRRFLRLTHANDPADHRDDTHRILETATRRIEQALETLKEARPAPAAAEPAADEPESEESPAETRDAEHEMRLYRLRQQADDLRAFATAFKAYLGDSDDSGPPGADSRDAASRLSPLLESEDPAVADAALFWQSVLLSRDEDLDAVLSRLDYINEPIVRAIDHYSFWGRVLRCRVMARHHPRSIPLALLLQLEERCFDWFADESKRESALRAVGLIRLQVLSAWYNLLDESTERSERAWCVDAAQRILDTRFNTEDHSVMRLAPLVPVVAPPPTDPPAGD